MPVFVEDPALFSKERLKSELIANDVALPLSEKKEVYLQLYLKHITNQNVADFSSDEEEAHELVHQGDSQEAALEGEENEDESNTEMMDISQLTDKELKAQLIKYGVKPGPIVGSTRPVYEKKLLKLIGSGSAVPTVKQNGTGDVGRYSDSEEDERASRYEQERKKVTVKVGQSPAQLDHSGVRKHQKQETYFPQCFAPCSMVARLPPVLSVSVPVPRKNPSTGYPPPATNNGVAATASSPLMRNTFAAVQNTLAVKPLYTSLEGSKATRDSAGTGISFSIAKMVDELSNRSPVTPTLGPIVSPATPVAGAVRSADTPIPGHITSPVPVTPSPVPLRRGSMGSERRASTGNMKGKGQLMLDKNTMTYRTPTNAPMVDGSSSKSEKEDVLEEMFPDEARTPTGISATRRRPIKGAAGRPVQFKYSELVTQSPATGDQKPPASRHLIPIWVQIAVFIAIAGFLFLIYHSMEANQDNPFSSYLENPSQVEEMLQEALTPPPETQETQDTPPPPLAVQE
ncbi:lamina-associated polypeptide 2, isoforms beta/delta/epsilon/gamma-like [Acipenser ruthenus]|uniref:lamina-associated polypeptide 2, isoforms beta/delta/epsilon/gamma-like n=1 Tax=Acipenser ruthenus TaxID=7906 RepID=UPI00274056B5|nr:lamina-associated polypeptide 2, isoforms beta/delta/epsilon/gamma-like [Acipenser ruthenus]